MTGFALIPARGGSKRIPGKNLRTVAGKTLVAHAIDCALGAGLTPVVSSDSDEICNHARANQAACIRRPKHLAQDATALEPVIEHAINAVSGYDTCVVLQPTSPLRTSKDVLAALRKLDEGADSVLAVVHCPQAAFCGRLNGDSFRHYNPVLNRPRTQDINSYADCGAIYAFRTSWFCKHKVRFGGNVRAVVLDAWSGLDVDNSIDLRLAGLMVHAAI